MVTMVGAATMAVASTALVIWLRKARKLGFSLGVRYELLVAGADELPEVPAADWLELSREARRHMPIFTPMEKLRGVRPKWSTKHAVIICEDVVRSSVDSSLLQVRAFLPRATATNETLPICVFFHGGGWVYGGGGSHDHIARYFASRGVVTVMVDYRLSPEHQYPVPLMDCLDALRWASRNADELGCDPKRLVVAGDSAGANLALCACLKARDHGYHGFSEDARIAGVLLVYPCVSRELVTLEGGSYSAYASGYGLTRERMAWFWRQYTGLATTEPMSSDELRYVAPLDTRTSLHALPPTMVLLADHDVCRDDGEQLVGRLRSAGVYTASATVPHTLHGLFTNRRLDPQAWELFVDKACTWIIKATDKPV
mmetsp:Transcript_29409/g.79043  ORF Transcript_29409/g.79043 Transcript_29409/m.79043 type:complete len:371 (+) Transcript_29409:110-1222(+)